MSPKLSNQKGAKYELTICRDLTEWITGQRKPELFWRNKGLGPKATRDQITGAKKHGDIVPLHGTHWVTDLMFWECKHYKETAWSLDELMKSPGQLAKWWKKLLRQANKANKIPMMVFKKNRFNDCLMMTQELMDRIKEVTIIDPPTIIHYSNLLGNTHICLWRNFLESVFYIDLKEIIQTQFFTRNMRIGIYK